MKFGAAPIGGRCHMLPLPGDALRRGAWRKGVRSDHRHLALTKSFMDIWVDADACPAQVKEILFRAAQRTQVRVTLVANAFLRTPPSPYIRALQVAPGPDVADRRIAESMQHGDLVITADIPLASDVLARGGAALDPRGGWFTADTIRERLAMRAMLDELRGAGVATGGPSPFSARDGRSFAAQLDGFLTRAQRRPPAG